MSKAEASEAKLTRVASRLALIEFLATYKRKAVIEWTGHVVGFVSGFKDPSNWLLIVLIVLYERARIYCRCREFEWEHMATKPSEMKLKNSSQKPMPKASDLPDARSLSRHSKLLSWLLFWVQVLCAFGCALLSVTQLIFHHSIPNGGCDKMLLIAYDAWALAEASLILAEKCCWMWMVVHSKLFEQVARDCGIDIDIVRKFFYESYTSYLERGEGLEMNIVAFNLDLLSSKSTSDHHSISSKILRYLNSRNKDSDCKREDQDEDCKREDQDEDCKREDQNEDETVSKNCIILLVFL